MSTPNLQIDSRRLHVVPRQRSLAAHVDEWVEKLDAAFDRATAWVDARYEALRFALRSPLDYRLGRIVYRAVRAKARLIYDILWGDVDDRDYVYGVCAVIVALGLLYFGARVGAFLSTGQAH